MNKLLIAVGVLAAGVAHAAPAVAPVKTLESTEQEVSYSFGAVFGRRMQNDIPNLDIPAFTQGLSDAYAGQVMLLSDERIQQVLASFQREMQQKQMEMINQLAAENLKKGTEYLEANKSNEGVVTLASGLQYKILTEGKGPQPGLDDSVRVHYTGTLIDGKIFDSSEGGEPAELAVGSVIAGWTEALQLMPEGSYWRLFIPADLAYGSNGYRDIGPNEVLLFDLQLLEVKRKAP